MQYFSILAVVIFATARFNDVQRALAIMQLTRIV